MPPLVELAVIRQIGFRHHAQYLAAVDHHGGVIELAMGSQRGADDQHRKQLLRSLDQLPDPALHRSQQRILEQQILDGVGGQAELREHHEGSLGGIASRGKPHGLQEIEVRVTDFGPRDARGEPDEIVVVERMKSRAHGMDLGAPSRATSVHMTSAFGVIRPRVAWRLPTPRMKRRTPAITPRSL